MPGKTRRRGPAQSGAGKQPGQEALLNAELRYAGKLKNAGAGGPVPGQTGTGWEWSVQARVKNGPYFARNRAPSQTAWFRMRSE